MQAGIVCQLRTRCTILAATNPSTIICQAESAGGVTGANIGITSPLLSRFDLIFIIRDEHNPVWDDMVAEHLLLDSVGDFPLQSSHDKLWTVEQLQNHFMTIRNYTPRMTTAASNLLGKYYIACRAHERRNPSRTTVRLLDSLSRLALAHARLVFRPEVTVEDAVAVIRLMESTWNFGLLVQPENVLRRRPPLGPSADEIQEICTLLGVDDELAGGTTLEMPQPPAPESNGTEKTTIDFNETENTNTLKRKIDETILQTVEIQQNSVTRDDVSSAAKENKYETNNKRSISKSTKERLNQFKNVNFVEPLEQQTEIAPMSPSSSTTTTLEPPSLPATLSMGSFLSNAWKNDDLDCLDDLDF